MQGLKSVHIIGVCGTLMGAFAAYLKRAGVQVTGSDQNVYPPMSDVLTAAGVKLFSGYKAENLAAISPRPELVIIGNVISRENPEAKAAIDGGYAYASLPETMERFMLPSTRNLVVAGTHGKTTTSSLLAHVLSACGRDPSWFIGGVSQDLPHSFHVSEGQDFVIEGDEYDTAFWDKVPKFNHYLPDHTILTSVEFDHADIYADLPAVVRAFDGLMSRMRKGGHVIACMDYPEVRNVVAHAKVEVIPYAASNLGSENFWPGRVTAANGEISFDVMKGNEKLGEVRLGIPGQHNVMNALAVWIECRRLGLESAEIARALIGFKGVRRRQEVRGEVGGRMVIDDFAHHPTAVAATLKALRMKYVGRRLVTVFEPRSATSRRKVFQQDYAAAFGEADAVFIASPYDQSKISSDDQFSSAQLVDDLKRKGVEAALLADAEGGIVQVSAASKRGDVIAVLSNGGFGGFIPKLLSALPTA